jgi:hypothetical protein
MYLLRPMNEEIALIALSNSKLERIRFPFKVVNDTLLTVYSICIVLNKMGIDKVLFSLDYRVWVWVRKKFC